MTQQLIEGHPVPPNEGGLPLTIERDRHGKIIKIRIAFTGFTIQEQFPWTRVSPAVPHLDP